MKLTYLPLLIALTLGCQDNAIVPDALNVSDATQVSYQDGFINGDTQFALDSGLEGPLDASIGADQMMTSQPLPYDFNASKPWFECPTMVFGADAIEVTAFENAGHYFTPENRRDITAEVQFPEGQWSQIAMMVDLSCPETGLCDHWDRSASIQLMLNSGNDDGPQNKLELARYITPYRLAMCQLIDVTELAPLLTGPQTLTSWIDTWVGAGHEAGDGWRLTVKFIFFPGIQTPAPEVINIWGRRSITVGQIGEDQTVATQTEPVQFNLPDQYSRVIAHLTTTGHSFGNTANCAEFCEMRQDLIINGATSSVNPWRSDCDQNPVTGQLGTWTYPRNGWCPGAISVGQRIDITGLVEPGSNELDFDIMLATGQPYENTTPVDLLPHEWVSLKLYIEP
jgi:hypothetical protein